MKTKEILKKEELNFFKTIKIRAILIENGDSRMEFKNREVFGTIHYIRKEYPNYNYLLGDDLDIAILKQAKAQFLNAELIINEPLIFNGQKEYLLNLNKHTLIQTLTINICPKFNIDEGVQLNEFTSYDCTLVKLNVYLQTYSEIQSFNKKDSLTNYHFHISIDYKEVEQIKSTIESLSY